MSNEQTEIHQQLNNVFVAVKNLTSDGIVNKIERKRSSNPMVPIAADYVMMARGKFCDANLARESCLTTDL